jgi:hypothetical protein
MTEMQELTMEQEDKKEIADIHKEVSKLRNEHSMMFTIFGFYQKVSLLSAESNKNWRNAAILWGVLAFFMAVISTISIFGDNAIYRIVAFVFAALLLLYSLYLWISVYKGFRTQEENARQILECTPMIGQIGLGESGGVSRCSPD